jgi:hypothetical protein
VSKSYWIHSPLRNEHAFFHSEIEYASTGKLIQRPPFSQRDSAVSEANALNYFCHTLPPEVSAKTLPLIEGRRTLELFGREEQNVEHLDGIRPCRWNDPPECLHSIGQTEEGRGGKRKSERQKLKGNPRRQGKTKSGTRRVASGLLKSNGPS